MFKSLFSLVFVLAAGLPFAFAQSFKIDPAIPRLPLNDQTELTVLNARLGSRFSNSLVTKEQGFHSGALGMDADNFTEWLWGYSIDNDTQNGSGPSTSKMLRTGALPRNFSFIDNQQIALGMTAMQLTGGNDLKLTATLVSPFTIAETLADSSELKTQIAPAYYLVMELTNNTKQTQKGSLLAGLKKAPYDMERLSNLTAWRRNREHRAHVLQRRTRPAGFEQ